MLDMDAHVSQKILPVLIILFAQTRLPANCAQVPKPTTPLTQRCAPHNFAQLEQGTMKIKDLTQISIRRIRPTRTAMNAMLVHTTQAVTGSALLTAQTLHVAMEDTLSIRRTPTRPKTHRVWTCSRPNLRLVLPQQPSTKTLPGFKWFTRRPPPITVVTVSPLRYVHLTTGRISN